MKLKLISITSGVILAGLGFAGRLDSFDAGMAFSFYTLAMVYLTLKEKTRD